MTNQKNKIFAALGVVVLLFVACESERRYPPQGYFPNTPKATDQLEAQYFWEPQDKISSSYWKDANFVELSLSDLATANLYPDGYLNMTGTYNGTADFNQGNDPKATLKAGYDDNYIYILVEWKDTTANASFYSWLWNGPEDDRKNDTTTGWTSQQNHDNFMLLFDTESAAKNAWKWSLAYTAPFDMALNQILNTNGDVESTDKLPYFRNGEENTSRTGPQYEWNGIRQELPASDGSIKVLDPAYYLLDENKMDFKGDVKAGMSVFNSKADCKFCHGIDGNGIPEGYTNGGALNNIFTNRYTREGLEEFIGSRAHEGSGAQYWGKIKNNTTDVENMLAFMRAIAGVPGHVLSGSETISSIQATTNIVLGGIDTKNTRYQVLLKRKLMPDSDSDITFDPAKTYSLSIRFSDNDEVNSIESQGVELIFKSNEL